MYAQHSLDFQPIVDYFHRINICRSLIGTKLQNFFLPFIKFHLLGYAQFCLVLDHKLCNLHHLFFRCQMFAQRVDIRKDRLLLFLPYFQADIKHHIQMQTAHLSIIVCRSLQLNVSRCDHDPVQRLCIRPLAIHRSGKRDHGIVPLQLSLKTTIQHIQMCHTLYLYTIIG